jgi:anti-sigma factor ChrR (cupin superfamily)
MDKRRVINVSDLIFEPFDRYGTTVPGMSWHKISYDDKTNFGTYISKLEPDTKTIPHVHKGYEEFFVLDGELIDSDGTVFNKGDFVTFKPGSQHNSYTKKGCMLLTFMRGVNESID